MDSGFRIAVVAGIDIRVNWTVGVIVALMTWSLADNVLPDLAEGYATGEYWVVAGVLSIALLGALVAHELGHSLVARSEGVRVTMISLWILGGIAQLASMPKTPRAAMRIAAAGPAVSAALAVVSLSIGAFLPGLTGVAFAWFGLVNAVLAGFNLLPFFPMDGGRVYQAWLWGRTGDSTAATRRAAALGHAGGAVLIGIGLVQAFFLAAIGGVWLVFVGWFVREASRAEAARVQMEGPLATTPIADVMSSGVECVDASSTVDAFVDQMVVGGRHAAYPVVGDDGAVEGLVSVKAVRSTPPTAWKSTTVGSVATPLERLCVVAPTSSVADALESIGVQREVRCLVMDGDRLLGVVSPSDIARLMTALDIAATRPAVAG